jgi:exopolysaccharide biosynthesis polyprenyl glycosylphosphotransferase
MDVPASPELARSAHNLAILRAVRRTLLSALAESARESAIRYVETAVEAAPDRPLLSRAWSRWSWRIGPVFAALDLLAVLGAWLVTRGAQDPAGFALIAMVIVIICNRADLHRSRLELSVLDDLPAYLLISLVGGLTFAGITSLRADSGSAAPIWFAFAGVLAGLFLTSRIVAYPGLRRLRRSRFVTHPVVIVGTGAIGQRLAAAMRAHPEYGLTPVGFVDFDPLATAHEGLVLPVLGGIGDLPKILSHIDVHDIVFAFSKQPDAHMVRIVRGCVRLDLQVFVVPRYFELCGTDRRARIETIWGIPLMRLRRWPLRPGNRRAKRLMDVLFAGVGLIALSPVLALCAVAVRCGGAPVIFRQQRVGLHGRIFVLYKFRSMRTGHDDTSRWSVTDDPGITRVGRFLRWTSLDELPQLVNVLRGDMSLVGPRPERPYFADSFAERIRRYGERHRVATGLTGWAQVHGLRGDSSIEDRVTFDNYYIENWSLWSDMKIILRTVTAMLRHRPQHAPVVVDYPPAPRLTQPVASTR